LSLDTFAKYLGILIFFAFLQVVLLNNIAITNIGLTPYLYIVFILILPLETPPWLLLVYAFSLGLIIDIFDDTGGLHSAALLFVAFLRPVNLRIMAPRDGYESGTQARIFHYGFGWFFKYALLSVFVHHLIFFFLDTFSFENFFYTLLRIFATTLLSVTVIMMSQYLIFRK